MLEFLRLLAGPLIGAGIGYCTNYIAVKMLFRPLHPITLFGRRLPLTPGVIPKEQARLAHAVGGLVGRELLNESDVKQMLLSDAAKEQVRAGLTHTFEQYGDTQLKQLCLAVSSDETAYESDRRAVQEKLTDALTEHLTQMQLGDIIAAHVLESVKQKITGSFFGRMVGDDMLSGFAGPIRDGIDSYLDGNAYALLRPQVTRAWDEMEHKTVRDVDRLLSEMDVHLTDMVMKIYEELICDKADSMMRVLDLGGIAERKIAAMPPAELEQLVYSMMDKELRAVVNLGALVGFGLGLLHLIV